MATLEIKLRDRKKLSMDHRANYALMIVTRSSNELNIHAEGKMDEEGNIIDHVECKGITRKIIYQVV